MTHTSERASRWTTLLLALALTPILGGGCTVFYSSDNDDDNDDDDDQNSSASAPADDGAITDAGTLAGIDGAAAQAGDAPPEDSAAPTQWNLDGLVVLLTEMPDADGDGVGELGLMLIEAVPADSGGAGELALAANAFLLSGTDGRVLKQRSDSDLDRPHATVSVTPLRAAR